MFHRHKTAVRFAEVTDGLSNTIMCGEALPSQNIHLAAFTKNLPMAATNIPINLMATQAQMPLPSMNDGQAHTANPATIMTGFKSRHPGGAQYRAGRCERATCCARRSTIRLIVASALAAVARLYNSISVACSLLISLLTNTTEP